jgi:hypothetical protein
VPYNAVASKTLSAMTARPDSDVDLLIVCDTLPNSRRSRVAQFLEMEDRLRAKHPPIRNVLLSPVLKTPAELGSGSPLLWDMTKEVAILFDRDGALARCLDGVRERLHKLGAHRVFRRKGWFWVLKADYRPGEVFET